MEIEMRRKKQALPKAECDAVLSRCTSGVLALAGADGKPYAVPLSYVYANGKLYFHCAASGRKLEMLRQNPQASFCVVDSDEVVPEQFTTRYRSVIVSGSLRELTEEGEKRVSIERLARKYSPDLPQKSVDDEIDAFWSGLCMLELTPDWVTGKESSDLARERQAKEEA